MTLLLATLIVAAALAAVLAPLVRSRPEPATPATAGPREEGDDLVARLVRARDEKRAVLEDLIALEADYTAGVLSEADYLELKRRDEARALALIERVDALEAALGPEGVAALSGSAGGPSSSARAKTRPAPAAAGGRPGSLVLAAGAALLLVVGVAGGYLAATWGRSDPTARVAGEGQPGMPAPIMEMVQQLRARLEANPRDVEALVGLGRLNVQRGDLPQAIDYFKRALEVDAGNTDALTGLGMILAESGSFTEAVATFDRVLARDPSHVEALWWKGQVQLYALKDYPAAVGTLERAVALLPPGPDQARVSQALDEARAAAAAPREPARPPDGR
ncbi:MAG TPA: tetratricopeptide repeat protein [Thermodesulfobacteriota bacterium]